VYYQTQHQNNVQFTLHARTNHSLHQTVLSKLSNNQSFNLSTTGSVSLNQRQVRNVIENRIKERASKQIQSQHALITTTAMYTTTAQQPS